MALPQMLLALTTGATNLLTIFGDDLRRARAYSAGYQCGYDDAQRRFSAALQRLGADYAVDAITNKGADAPLAQRAATAAAVDPSWAVRYLARVCLTRMAQIGYTRTQRSLDSRWSCDTLHYTYAKQMSDSTARNLTERHLAIIAANYDLQAGPTSVAVQNTISSEERTGLANFAINARHYRYTNVRTMLSEEFKETMDSQIMQSERSYDRYVHDGLLNFIPNGAIALVSLENNACHIVDLGYGVDGVVTRKDGYSQFTESSIYLNRGVWYTQLGTTCCDDVCGSSISDLLVIHGCLRPTADALRSSVQKYHRWYDMDGPDTMFSYAYSRISANSPIADVSKVLAKDQSALTRLAKIGQYCGEIAVHRIGDRIIVYPVVRPAGIPCVYASIEYGMRMQAVNFFTGVRLADLSDDSYAGGASTPPLAEAPLWYGNLNETGSQVKQASACGRSAFSYEFIAPDGGTERTEFYHKPMAKILRLSGKLGNFDQQIDTPYTELNDPLRQTANGYTSEIYSALVTRLAEDRGANELQTGLLARNRIVGPYPDQRYLINSATTNEQISISNSGKIIR